MSDTGGATPGRLSYASIGVDGTLERRQMSVPADREPPGHVGYDLEEALELLAALEDARDILSESDHLSVLAQVEHQIGLLTRRLGFDQGGAGAS